MNRITLFLILCIVLALSGCGASPEAFRPSKEAKAAAEKFLVWSESVNGLRARIEIACDDLSSDYRYCEKEMAELLLVRIQNTSDKTLAIPGGNPSNFDNPSAYELYAKEKSGWRRIPWRADPTQRYREWALGTNRDREDLLLAPGESALVYLSGGGLTEALKQASDIKVALRISQATRPGGWSGFLETPPRPIRVEREIISALDGRLDFPRYYPEFTGVAFPGYNPSHIAGMMYMNRSLFDCISVSNGPLLRQLEWYKPDDIVAEMERRMKKESEIPLVLIYAAEAAKRGSAEGKTFLLEKRKNTDAIVAESTVDALCELAQGEQTPGWVLNAMLDALHDEREIEGKERMIDEDAPTIANLNSNLFWSLARTRSKRAISALIELARNPKTKKSSDAIMALGAADGNEEAIAALLDIAKSMASEASISPHNFLFPGRFELAIQALAELKAKSAVPFLTENIIHKDVVEALDRIGDQRAVPALRKVIADGRPRQVQGSNPETDKACVLAAKMTLAGFEASRLHSKP